VGNFGPEPREGDTQKTSRRPDGLVWDFPNHTHFLFENKRGGLGPVFSETGGKTGPGEIQRTSLGVGGTRL